MKKKIYLAFALVSFSILSFAQNQNEDFKPNGKPVVQVFSNFHSSFNNKVGTSAFEIQRAYFGYEYNFSKEWNAKIVFDVADPGTGNFKMTAFLKNSYLKYKKNNFTAYFGMIATTQFKVSEEIWGNRYIEKSFQDAYKFNSSADLGFNLDYKLASFASIDFSVINGEGFKKLQSDKFFRPGLGITLNPVKNITARVFADIYGDTVKQKSLATFLAYTGEKLKLGAEYNMQKNFGMADAKNLSGLSFFANYQVSQKVKLFGRFDNLKSNTVNGATQEWNKQNDGQLFLAGLEFSPVKGVKLAPNFRGWNPSDNTQKFVTSLYFNCELKF